MASRGERRKLQAAPLLPQGARNVGQGAPASQCQRLHPRYICIYVWTLCFFLDIKSFRVFLSHIVAQASVAHNLKYCACLLHEAKAKFVPENPSSASSLFRYRNLTSAREGGQAREGASQVGEQLGWGGVGTGQVRGERHGSRHSIIPSEVQLSVN